jgi:UDP-glucose 4-epimerase
MRGVRTVLHLAAVPSVTRSVSDPATTHAVNVDGTFRLLEAARAERVARVVVYSSSSVYGDSPELPKRETMRPVPISPYGASKLAAEALVSAWAASYGMSIVALRPFNVYGPRQDPASEYAAVVPRFVTVILEGRAGTIYGDGSQTRDFTYVDDMVDATFRAARWDGGKGAVFNVSGGARTSVLELYAAVERVVGVSLPPVLAPARTGDILHSHADGSAARAFGYTPRVPLTDGIARTVEWFRTGGRAG